MSQIPAAAARLRELRPALLAALLGAVTAALAALAVAAGLPGSRLVRRVQVEGDSMRPALEPGDRLVLLAARRARPGDLVGVADPRRPSRLLVKRVVERTSAGYTVAGDNEAASTDSRHFGTVRASGLRGRAVYRYAPEHRRGRL